MELKVVPEVVPLSLVLPLPSLASVMVLVVSPWATFSDAVYEVLSREVELLANLQSVASW